MSVSSASGRHFIDDYTGGPEGLAPIVAHCGCGVVSRPLLTLDEADRDLEVHVPAPQHATDIRRVEIYQAYCSCGWESEPEETPEGADALADEHDDAALSARSRAVVAVRAPSRPTNGDGDPSPGVAAYTSPPSIPRRSTSACSSDSTTTSAR